MPVFSVKPYFFVPAINRELPDALKADRLWDGMALSGPSSLLKDNQLALKNLRLLPK
jgi:hypothetical protein